MKHITKFLWLFIGLFPLLAAGQDPFYAKVSKTQMSEDDRLRIDFVLTQKEESFSPPEFIDFEVIMGPSVSQSYSWINGKSSFTKTYTYILQPRKTGTLQIGPASAVINGKTYQTQPVTVTVHKAETPPPTSPAPGEKNSIATGGNNKDIFLTLELTNARPYVQEAVGGIYKLYIKEGVNASNFEITQLPEYQGFWVEKVSDKFEGPFTREINGQKYQVYHVSKILLFPQQSGTLKIKPLKATIYQITYEERVFGLFREMVEVPKKLRLSSGTKIIKVKDLPEEGKPDIFNGAVGRYDMEFTTEKDTVRPGEAVTMHLKVKGTGNLGLIELPDIQLPPDLEVFEPEIKRNYRATLSGYKGSVEKIYTVIPQKPGKYIIPGIRFAYFDPKTSEYHLLETQEHILVVEGPAPAIASGNPSTPAPNQNLAPLITETKWQSVQKTRFYGSTKFIFLTLLPFVILLLAWGYKKYRDKVLSNPETVQRKKIRTELDKLWKQAASQTGDKEAFYGTLEKILFTYFKDKWGLRPVDITKQNVERLLRQKGIDPDLINRLNGIWQQIQSARYTPLQTGDMENDLHTLKELLRQLDKTL